MEILMNKELWNRKYLPLPPLNAFTTEVSLKMPGYTYIAFPYLRSYYPEQFMKRHYLNYLVTGHLYD